MNRILSCDTVAALIRSNRVMVVAGSAEALLGLPRGCWVGAVTHDFIASAGCARHQGNIMAVDFTDYVTSPLIVPYSYLSLGSLFSDIPDGGFTYVLIPAFGDVHRLFSTYSLLEQVEDELPLVGWVSGLDNPTEQAEEPIVINGQTGEVYSDSALAFHCTLRSGYRFWLEVCNPYAAVEGDRLQFTEQGFAISQCTVNGVPQDFYEYLQRYGGEDVPTLQAMIGYTRFNVHALVDHQLRCAMMTMPVISGVDYQTVVLDERVGATCRDFMLANPAQQPGELVSTISCLGLYNRVKTRQTEALNCPGVFTYGEIAHYLHNEVIVKMHITPQPQ